MENKRIILIVDDDVTSLRLLQAVLKDLYETAPARSGEQALTYLEQHTPDVILLDLDMPVMNGYEVLGRLKSDARWKDIPVISTFPGEYECIKPYAAKPKGMS